MTWVVWLIIAAVLIIFEVLTTSVFFFLCFSIGAIFAAIVSYFASLCFVEFIVFTVISIICLYLVRPIFKIIINKSGNVNSNTDALIGAEAVVTEKIMPFKTGFVKVSNEIWRAKCDAELAVGETVKIKNISGTTLIVKKMGG